MFQKLFGTDVPHAAWFLIGLVILVGLICATVWLVRRFGARRPSAPATGGRRPQLAVIDVAAVDARRRLILIRRDNTEHLMMIGGPTDVVIESNIVPAARVLEAQPLHPSVAGDMLPRTEAPRDDITRPPEPDRAQRRPAPPQAAPRHSEQVLRAEPPMRPQPTPPPPTSPTVQREPWVDDQLSRLAETLARRSQPDNTHASELRGPRRELPPLPTSQREPRTSRSQPMMPPPALPTSAQPSAPVRAPVSGMERSSAFMGSSPDD
jgi:flagellar biogenesis protein FliO